MNRTARVLWVDDGAAGSESPAEADARTGPVAALDAAGFDVAVATREAVSERATDRDVDCLVVLTRNDDDAAALVERVDAVGTTPVVVVGVEGDERLAHRVVARGADEYLPATVVSDGLDVNADLVAAVERAVETGRRRRECARTTAQLRALFDDAPDPVVEYEFADGEPVATAVNGAFVDVFGYDREAVVGEPMNDRIVPEGREAEAERLDERVAAGDRVAAEVTRETADGDREFLFRNIAVETDERGPDGYAVYVDIGEQRARERRLQRQNERLEEFASVVSHDLRNPMGAAKHRIEMARQTGDDDHLEAALDGLDRMEELLRDLLRLARQGDEVGRTEPVSLRTVAEEAWTHVATDGATLDVVTDAVVEADRGRLTQLLENLYINAVEHGGRAEDAAPSVTVGVDEDECLYVADDGCGIPVDERAKVFSSGYSTGRDGTGYGLTIVTQVARAHGWEVGVTESRDGGARFEFRGAAFHER